MNILDYIYLLFLGIIIIAAVVFAINFLRSIRIKSIEEFKKIQITNKEKFYGSKNN